MTINLQEEQSTTLAELISNNHIELDESGEPKLTVKGRTWVATFLNRLPQNKALLLDLAFQESVN
ncbi:MAG: hypothetical protein ACE3L7_03980 [Candidatus Pristimantibacillus sp.]